MIPCNDSRIRLLQLYVQDLKCKRERILKDKRDMCVSEEDDLDFFKTYCKHFFGRQEDPWEVDEDLLTEIWEEIKLEGFYPNLFNQFYHGAVVNECFWKTEMETAEAGMMQSLLDGTTTTQIVCPVCLKSPAKLSEGCVVCCCGLRFPLPRNITLGDFESALVASAELHHLNCSAVPQHSVRTSGGTLQFVSTCETCQTFSIIFEHSSTNGSS